MHCDSNGVSPSAYPLSVGPLVAAAEPAGYVYFYFFLHTLPSCCMGRSEGHVASPSPFLKDPPPKKKKGERPAFGKTFSHSSIALFIAFPFNEKK